MPRPESSVLKNLCLAIACLLLPLVFTAANTSSHVAAVFGGVCGDGVIDAGEQCDDAGESATCDDDCTFAVCGDSTLNVSSGELCDDGNTTGGDGCSAACTPEFCGNGVVDGLGEQCDDGNNTNGDGCDATCQLESMASVPALSPWGIGLVGILLAMTGAFLARRQAGA